MFTGIIETMGIVKEIKSVGTNKTFWIKSSISSSFKIDQSVSHNGICFTIEEVNSDLHKVTAVAETIEKTNIIDWQLGDYVNLERSILMNGPIDGHFVQGHIDTKGRCTDRIDKNGSWEFQFQYPKKFASLIIEKGSISINGISLTAFNVKRKTFQVAIIPYTFNHTNIQFLEKGNSINLEFDMIGKYIIRHAGTK